MTALLMLRIYIYEERMRTMHDAILVGIGTALNDDPQLNSASNQVLRVSVDSAVIVNSASFACSASRLVVYISLTATHYPG